MGQNSRKVKNGWTGGMCEFFVFSRKMKMGKYVFKKNPKWNFCRVWKQGFLTIFFNFTQSILDHRFHYDYFYVLLRERVRNLRKIPVPSYDYFDIYRNNLSYEVARSIYNDL